jgi:hypothetical protein
MEQQKSQLSKKKERKQQADVVKRSKTDCNAERQATTTTRSQERTTIEQNTNRMDAVPAMAPAASKTKASSEPKKNNFQNTAATDIRENFLCGSVIRNAWYSYRDDPNILNPIRIYLQFR